MAKPWDQIDGDTLASMNAAISNAGGTEEDATWVCGNGNATSLVKWIRTRRGAEGTEKVAIERATQPPSLYSGNWWNERAKAPYLTYPPGWQMNDVLTQCQLLTSHLGRLDASHVEPLLARYLNRFGAAGEYRLFLPGGMDGILTSPKLDKLASLVPDKKSWTDIDKAIWFLLGVLGEVVPNFKDRTEGCVGPGYHRLFNATAGALAEDAARTPGDFHVFPVQSGTLYSGYSERAARGHISARPREYPMPCFMAACLILGSPGRIAEGALVINCGGSERAPGAVGSFRSVPCFGWINGRPEFSDTWIAHPGSDCGSASFVLPEP